MGLFDRRMEEAEETTAPESAEVGPSGTLVDQVAAYSAARAAEEPAALRERRFERSEKAKTVDHADLADHIKSVLNAAEAAAEQIREAAAEEAARMLEDARTTKLEAERTREQVEQDRATTYKAAEAVAAQIRIAAEQEAEDIVGQAHVDAK